MSLIVEELISELEKYDKNKKVRVLFGMPTPILWLSHNIVTTKLDNKEYCTLFTSDKIKSKLREFERIETVENLLWHLQFFKKDSLVLNYDLCGYNSYIQEVSDKIKDNEGNIIDTVFLINFAHIVR